jgi:hypothetical protein
MTCDLGTFSDSYAEARAQFLAEAAASAMQVWSYPHPLPGSRGEPLALDVALAGPADAERLLIVTSAVHGVEGFCGSGVQVHALRHHQWYPGRWPDAAGECDVAVLFLHAVNPWGFSHLRRVTNENVDLNRNFADFAAPPANPGYRRLHKMLVPTHWPPNPADEAALAQFEAAQGTGALQTAVSSGQYEFPDGLFYGGSEPTWSHRTLRRVLREHAGAARQVAWVDLHTGLGPAGHGERICAEVAGQAWGHARAEAWWGNAGRTPITRKDDGSSASARLDGTLGRCLSDDLAHAEATKITIEFGTVPPMEVLQALRAEQWLHNHPQTAATIAAPIKQALRNAFYVDDRTWKAQVLTQSLEALTQGVVGLRSVG